MAWQSIKSIRVANFNRV